MSDNSLVKIAEKYGDESRAAMTPRQQSLGAASGLHAYRRLMSGDAGFLPFLAGEAYSVLCADLPGALGFVARRALLPRLLRHCESTPIVGRGVTIRVPNRISLGRSVTIDDYSVIDVRVDDDAQPAAGIELGDNVLLGRNSLLIAKNGRIVLRRSCNISSFCRIATQTRVEIGESVLVAAYVYIGPGNHRADSLDTPLISQGMEVCGGVTIGANSWIGTHSTVLDGVTIGRDVIVGAHSLVREDVPDRAIVAGVPAKVLRFRE